MGGEFDLIYKNYWQRKQLIKSQCPHFKTVSYHDSEDLNPTEKLIFSAVQSSQHLLDYGAGDLRIKNKLLKAGYKGDYKTLDFGGEYQHSYSDVSQIQETFDAILFLDVIEHLPLADGLSLLWQLFDKLDDQGYLILQTPNGRCIRNQKATDMTHLHIYNLKDLWSYMSLMGCEVVGYRVVYEPVVWRWRTRIYGMLANFMTVMVGCDYADNILLIAQKKNKSQAPPRPAG